PQVDAVGDAVGRAHRVAPVGAVTYGRDPVRHALAGHGPDVPGRGDRPVDVVAVVRGGPDDAPHRARRADRRLPDGLHRRGIEHVVHARLLALAHELATGAVMDDVRR